MKALNAKSMRIREWRNLCFRHSLILNYVTANAVDLKLFAFFATVALLYSYSATGGVSSSAGLFCPPEILNYLFTSAVSKSLLRHLD